MLNLLSGIIHISAIGAYYEEFINALFNNNIKILNSEINDGVLNITAKRTDYRFIAVTAKIFGIKTHIEGRKGLFFLLKKFKKRYGLFSGIIVSVFMLLVLENFVWKIDINGNSDISDNQILSVLNKNGINLGAPKLSFDVNSVENELKRELPEISWANIDLEGSIINVKINESYDNINNNISLKSPCNVIAGKNGRITETEVYSGELLYPVGSGVSEGSIIVSGTVNDGAGHILLTHANAKIIAEFTEEIEFSMPYTTTERKETGLIETEKELNLFGFVIPLTKKINDKTSKTCREENSVFDFLSFRLPWSVRSYIYTEYEDITVTRKEADCERILEKKLEDYCSNFYNDYEILNIDKSISITEEAVSLKASVLLKGDIAQLKEIYTK